MNDFATFVILSLAVWRLSSLLARESGPLSIFDKLRYRIGVRYDDQSRKYGTNELAKGLICIWCVSVWIGAVTTVAYLVFGNIVVLLSLPLALSGMALVVEGVVGMD